jgi:hypothetical protein
MSRLYDTLFAYPETHEIFAHLEEGFEKGLFRAVLRNLSDIGNPLRFNNFAYGMREVISILLRRYSSDAEVLRCSWYKSETNDEKGVSRAQRIRYAIRGGLSDEALDRVLGEEAAEEFTHLLRRFQSLFKSLSKHTHVREETFDIGDVRCETMASEILGIVEEILFTIKESRRLVLSHVEDNVNRELVGEFVSNTFAELDILSTHTALDFVTVDELAVETIDSTQVVVRGEGFAHCDLQYGSGSDQKSGMGDRTRESFPYTFECRIDVDNFNELEIGDIEIDTSSWYE